MCVCSIVELWVLGVFAAGDGWGNDKSPDNNARRDRWLWVWVVGFLPPYVALTERWRDARGQRV